MKYSLFLLLSSALLIGCSQKAIPTHFERAEAEKYPPINLDIYAGKYINEHTSKIIDFMHQAIEQSNLFLAIEPAFARWPFSVRIKYSRQNLSDGNSAKGILKGVVSGATLLLVPSYFDEKLSLNIDVFVGNRLLKGYAYEEHIETALSLYHDPQEDRKNGIKAVLDRFFADLQKDQILPKMQDLKQSPTTTSKDQAF